ERQAGRFAFPHRVARRGGRDHRFGIRGASAGRRGGAQRIPRTGLRHLRAGGGRCPRRAQPRTGRFQRRAGRVRGRGAAFGDDRLFSAGRVRRHLHLRAHAAEQDQGPRPVVRGQRVGGHRPHAAAGPAGDPGKHYLSGHHPRRGAAHSGGGRAHGGRGLLRLLQPRAGGSRQPGVAHAQHAQGHRRHHGGVPAGGRGDLRAGVRYAGAGAERRGGRAGEGVREHLPHDQHRPGQRAGAGVREAAGRRLGRNRGGGHQAVRLHEVHAGPGAGRTLHSAGPALPFVEDAHAGVPHADDRAGQRDQRRDAGVRGGQGGRRAERREQAGAGQRRAGAGRGVQEGHRRPARKPGARHHAAAAGQGGAGELPRPVLRSHSRRRPHPAEGAAHGEPGAHRRAAGRGRRGGGGDGPHRRGLRAGGGARAPGGGHPWGDEAAPGRRPRGGAVGRGHAAAGRPARAGRADGRRL
ncbi:MAG: UDP-N-acetyl-D-glucosamine 6-dehydrogenase, partial [uncultured Gemmatimonadetes bacterium]